jgi:hypothetical protein
MRVYSVLGMGVFCKNGGILALPGTKIEKVETTSSPRARYPCRLTDKEIQNAKAKEKAYSKADGGGLYLWITPAGGKLWRWSYRFDGKEKLMSLGECP